MSLPLLIGKEVKHHDRGRSSPNAPLPTGRATTAAMRTSKPSPSSRTRTTASLGW